MGSVDTGQLEPDEAQLAIDEAPYLLIGMLKAAGVRLVDEPFDIQRAEIKQVQFAVADRIGAVSPVTRITNDYGSALDLASRGRIVAKAVSPGSGIAPFVGEVSRADLELVTGLPTMLQELIDATADLRIVVVDRDVADHRKLPRDDH
jgi:glutathione synthase/RimK-type ligase-like ATP-grasp enzyme